MQMSCATHNRGVWMYVACVHDIKPLSFRSMMRASGLFRVLDKCILNKPKWRTLGLVA